MQNNKKISKSYNLYHTTTSGFTLLELLLVIAVIASLAGIILVALNPAQRLEDASNTKALSTASDIEKAIKVYSIDNSGNLPSSLQSITTNGIYDICKSGQTIGCINLDELVTGGKLSSIPEDNRFSTTYKSGYKLGFNPIKAESKVYSQDEYIQATKYCPPGDTCNPPVAEWLFDENAGITASDSSGNNNNASLTNGPTWSQGKIGNSVLLDGINDFINSGDINTLDGLSSLSISLWFKSTNLSTGLRGIVTKWDVNNASWFVGHNNNEIRVYVTSIADNYSNYIATTSTNLQINTWYHLTVTYNGASQTVKIYINGVQQNTSLTGTIPTSLTSVTQPVLIGKQGAINYEFAGSIDNLKIYNYTRTPEQVEWEYNFGSPIYHYKFDECQGSAATNSAIDANGNLLGNNGTISIGASGTNTSLGTCSGSAGQAWKDGANGMFNSSIEFDGTDDYIDIAHNINQVNLPITIMAWVKSSTVNQGDWKAIISKYPPSAMNGWNIDSSSGNYYFYYYASSSNRLNTGSYGIPFGSASPNWTHLAAVVDYTKANLYRNGVLVYTLPWTGTASNSTQTANLQLGRITGNSTYSFNGQIDDIKIYNYALTASQIMQSMHEI